MELRNKAAVKSRLAKQGEVAQLLYDRLIWLRNHYDVGSREVKEHVLADIDKTLEFAEKADERG